MAALPLLVAMLVVTGMVAAAPAVPAPRAARAAEHAARDKSPRVAPSRPLRRDSSPARAGFELRRRTPAQLANVADTTAPIGPLQVIAHSQSTVSISAQWDVAQDPESGIANYVFGIGTNPTGTYATLANVRYWQVINANAISLNLTLDPALTYYVSVFAVNGAGTGGTIATSNALHPVWQALGQGANTVQISFAATGYDGAGNPTTGWAASQVSTMSTFFSRIYPILVQLYGPPAVSYTVTLVRDLRYHNSNIFMPSLDEIHMDDGFYPQLFTHELVHAFRNDFILSSDATWNYDATLSPFEESFAQGVSYDAMNAYVAAYPNDTIVAGNTLWGSSNDWDYDFQNVAELRGTDFWSDGGGTGLYWLRYEMGAAAIRKIQIESPGFYQNFNTEYYRRVNANPATVRPTRALIVDIIKTVVPQIEGVAADVWLDAQNIFYARNVYGEKIFHQIQDYPAGQFFVFHNMYFTDTMACGSEWACWDGQQWVYYRLNGSQGSGRLVDADGNVKWSGTLSIQPALNPSDGNYAFGAAHKSFTTAASLQPWPGGDPNDYVLGLTTLSLYRFDRTFVDPASGAATTNTIYRVLGAPIANSFGGVYGGVLGHQNGTLYLNHEGYANEAGLPVVHGAFAGTRSWTGLANARTGGHDSVPGRVFATFVDSDTGATYTAQRNIDYGSATGSQMFLFDFSDVTAPSVSLTAPATGANVSGLVSISATSSDNVAVSRVDFFVDGVFVGTDASTPYAISWNAEAAALGAHTIRATAYDTTGNSAATPNITVSVVDRTAPTLVITNPLNGTTVPRSKKLTISATASDLRGVTRVEFYVNKKLKCTDGTIPYSCVWAVPITRNAVYTVRARAYDAAGNYLDATVVVTAI